MLDLEQVGLQLLIRLPLRGLAAYFPGEVSRDKLQENGNAYFLRKCKGLPFTVPPF